MLKNEIYFRYHIIVCHYEMILLLCAYVCVYEKRVMWNRRHWQGGGVRGHGGKLQREDYRQLGYQATISLLALAREPSMSFESSLSFDALVT